MNLMFLLPKNFLAVAVTLYVAGEQENFLQK